MNRRAIRVQVLGAMLALCGASAESLAEESITDAQAIEGTREALDSSWTYPWYDAEKDALNRIETERPWDNWWPDWNWNWNLGSGPSGGFWTALLWAVVIGVLALVTYFLVKAILARDRGLAGALGELSADELADNAARVRDLPFEIDPKGGNLWELARHFYEQGDFNSAVIYLYSHQLIELDRHQQIRLAKGKTNRQYLRELSSRQPLRRLLERTMLAFEDAFFGDHEVTRERFEAVWRDSTRFSQLAGGVT